MATIWDADILIWAASQIVEAENLGLQTSRFLRFTPYQLLTSIGRETGQRDYKLLKGALTRLQSTVIRTTIRQGEHWRRHQFSWINEWEECVTRDGRVEGMEFVLPDWFYRGVTDRSLVLTIDPAYFRLTGGIELALPRALRKHAGRQPPGLDFRVRPSPRKVRQPHARLRLRASAPAHRPAPAAARLSAAHRAQRSARAAAHPAGEVFDRTCGRRCGRGPGLRTQTVSGFRTQDHRDFARRDRS